MCKIITLTSSFLLSFLKFIRRFSSTYQIQDHRGTGAYPSCHTVRDAVYTGQATSLNRTDTEIDNHSCSH